MIVLPHEGKTQITNCHYITIYPRDMSTSNISTTCPAVPAKSLTSFKASPLLQVVTKPSLTRSKSHQGYRDFKILRVRLADYLILARMFSRDLVGGLLASGGVCSRGGLTWVEEGYRVVHHRFQGIMLSI
jgi:hypothetical protein